MIILDKTKPPKPFFIREPIPTTFKNTYEKQKYWANEKKKWIEGISEDVNGWAYYYGSQIILRHRNTGAQYYPEIRDVEVWLLKEVMDCMKSGEFPFIIKGRGVGLSSLFMNGFHYFSRIYPNSNCIATSKNKKTLSELFTEKTMVSYNEMHGDIKPDEINKNQTASESFLKYGYRYLDDFGNEKYSENKFTCRDTQESDAATTNFSGSGAIYGFADEAPLMTRFNKFFDSARDCFTDHSINKVVGLMVFGGTCEDSITQDAIQKIQEVWENPKPLNIRPIFVPATYGKHTINGHSNHERAREEILKQREELDKLADKTRLNAYIKNNPLDISEIFSFGGTSRFDDYARERINLRLSELSKPNQAYVPQGYNLIEKGLEIVAMPSNSSNLKIIEHPKKDVKYIWSLDSTQSTKETSGDGGSKVSITIMKGVDPQSDLQFCPVAHFLERPKNFDSVFELGVRLFKYYNQFGLAKNCGELNATGGVMCEKLRKECGEKTIIARRDLNKKGYVDTKKAWYYRVDATIDWQYLAANTYFKKYSDYIYFADLLKEAQLPDEVNKDFMDSFLGCLWGFGTGDLLGEKPKEKKEVKYIEGVKWDSAKGKYIKYNLMTGKEL